jgi:co-chaperonin GroES (HSP10)
MNSRKLQPSGDHILIKYAEAATATRRLGKVVRVPKQKSAVARVIAIGPGRERADGSTIPLGLKVGQRVFVDGARGIRIRLNRQSYTVIRKRDLVGLAS